MIISVPPIEAETKNVPSGFHPIDVTAVLFGLKENLITIAME